MSLRLIYGAPHSGHTERVYDELIREAKAHPERQFIMLVPEQASLTVQEELVTQMVKEITDQIFNATVANW